MKRWLENKWILSVSAGMLLGLSFPPINLSFLSIPAFMLLFHMNTLCSGYKEVAYYSYPGFVIWNAIGTYWLMMASPGAGIAAIFANSVLMTIPMSLAYLFSKKDVSPIWVALFQATVWVSYEFLHHHWDLSWTWLALGNAWANWISLIQYISVTGFLGISFWVVFTAALAYQTLIHRTRKLMTVTLLVFLFFPAWSFILFDKTDMVPEKNEIEVAIIQPNHDSYQPYGGMSNLTEVIDSLFSITSKVRTPDTQLILWPENAIDGFIPMDSPVAMRIADSAKVWNAHFIAGAGIIKTYKKDTKELYRGLYRGKPFNVVNAALFAYPDGQLSYYEKGNLVPVVERIPFLGLLEALDLFDWVNWGEIAGFVKGDSPDMLASTSLQAPGLICYDSVYPSWIRSFVRNDASFITIITNDGWWGKTSGHLQHFAYARLRAIEFDRWIARSANNGISGMIAPNGEIMYETDYWVRTGFTARLQPKNTVTFYTLFGDWFSYTALFLTIALALGARWLKKAQN